jgi:hypothetical protein
MTTYHSVRFSGREGGTVDGSKVLAEVIAGAATADTLLAAGSFGTSGGFAVSRTLSTASDSPGWRRCRTDRSLPQ